MLRIIVDLQIHEIIIVSDINFYISFFLEYDCRIFSK